VFDLEEDEEPEPPVETKGQRVMRLLRALPPWLPYPLFGAAVLATLILWSHPWAKPDLAVHPPPAAAASNAAPASASAAASDPSQPAPSEATALVDARSVAASDAPTAADAAARALADDQAAAQETLEARLPENKGVQYKDVRTIVSNTDADGQPRIDFCGEVNSLNPMGTYIGFQRFISSPHDAKIEQGFAPGEFDQAWRQDCTGRQGPDVWK
jgi:hypothetical protein